MADYKEKPELEWGMAAMVAISLFIILGWWIVASYHEAAVFSKVTGKEVTTWDAMWVNFRIQEPARMESDDE